MTAAELWSHLEPAIRWLTYRLADARLLAVLAVLRQSMKLWFGVSIAAGILLTGGST